MQLADRIQNMQTSATVRIADLATTLRREGKDVLDFSAGRAAEHTPAFVTEAAVEAMRAGDTHQTMARGKPRYLEACVRKLDRENGLNVDPRSEVIATLGCKQGLTLALLATLNAGDEILVEDPAFVSYAPTILVAGAVPVAVPLRRELGWRWNEQELESAVTTKTRAILYCSPHNPTGTVHTTADLSVIAGVAQRHNLFVLADETYERLTWDNNRHTCIATLPDMRERTVGIMGLTKSFSMGGWRIGFAYASRRIVDAMTTLQQHLMTCAGAFTQTGAAFAIGGEAPTEQIAGLTDLWSDWGERCRYSVASIDAIKGLGCSMPQGGFYAWIDARAVDPASEKLSDYLLREHGIALVPGRAFGPAGEGFLRMTCVKSWDDMREGIRRLQNGIEDYG